MEGWGGKGKGREGERRETGDPPFSNSYIRPLLFIARGLQRTVYLEAWMGAVNRKRINRWNRIIMTKRLRSINIYNAWSCFYVCPSLKCLTFDLFLCWRQFRRKYLGFYFRGYSPPRERVKIIDTGYTVWYIAGRQELDSFRETFQVYKITGIFRESFSVIFTRLLDGAVRHARQSFSPQAMQSKCDSKKINVKSTSAVVAELAFRTAKKRFEIRRTNNLSKKLSRPNQLKIKTEITEYRTHKTRAVFVKFPREDQSFGFFWHPVRDIATVGYWHSVTCSAGVWTRESRRGGGLKSTPWTCLWISIGGHTFWARGRTPWPSSPGKYSPAWNPQKWTFAMPISKWVHTRKVQSSVLELT